MKQIIIKFWAAIGGIAAVVPVIYVFIFSGNGLSSLRSIAIINLAFLMFHQFEEYIYPGGFREFINENIAGRSRLIPFNINNRGVITVNIVLGWGLYSAGVIIPIPVFIMILLGSSLLNGIVHTAALIKLRKYNPGFITGMFLFVPFTIYAGNLIIRSGSITPNDWYLILPFIIAGLALIPVTLYYCRESGV